MAVAALIAFSVISAACATADNSPLATARVSQSPEAVCANVPTREREMGLLAYRSNLAGAAVLSEASYVGHVKMTHERGAVLSVRAMPGLSAPWLDRVVSCHVAMVHAGLVQGTTNDPSLVAGAQFRVDQSDGMFLISIRAGNDDAGRKIVTRTASLFANAPPASF